MRTRNGFLLGAVAGLIVGLAGPALAVVGSWVGSAGWIGGSALQRADRAFQLGYVAGLDDAVQGIVKDGMAMSTVTRQAGCLAKHHSSLGLKAFGDWALTLPPGQAANAASTIIRKACGTPTGFAPGLPMGAGASTRGQGGTFDPYQATVIVTGYDMRSRPSGFAEALRSVLVNVSGDPRLRTDPRVAALAKHADRLVASFSYVDKMAGVHYHDEQGTYDRPYDLTVKFDRARIDGALAGLGERSWHGARPVVMPLLTVRTFSGASYLLTAESRAGAEQRQAFADVARDYHMTVRFPTGAEFARWGVTVGRVPPVPPTSPEGTALVAGTLEFQSSLPGWVGSWRWRWHGAEYRWGITGVNYDEAFRDIVRGVLRVASGHSSPE